MNNPDTILRLLAEYNLEGFSHTDHGLINHLRGTFQILESWGCSETLCIAGLCHSIYGTESYRRNPIELSERENIQAILGESAEKLVYLFGAHVKESLWKNLERENEFSILDRLEKSELKLSELDLRNLITLTLANWLEQRPRVPEKYLFIRQNEFLQAEKYLPEKGYQDFKQAYGL